MELAQETLDEFLFSTPNTVINSIHDKFDEWQNLLSEFSTPHVSTTEYLLKILKILGSKVSLLHNDEHETDNPDHVKSCQAKILAGTCGNAKFIDTIKNHVVKMSRDPENQADLLQLLEHISYFCNEVIHVLPSLAVDSLQVLVCACVGVTVTNDQYSSLHGHFVEIQGKLNSAHKVQEEVDSYPPEDFREIRIVPSLQELVGGEPVFLRPNKVIFIFCVKLFHKIHNI